MKAVFFDFDGTLTYKSPNIWRKIWNACGYDTSKDSYYAKLYRMFISKQITHQEWCDLTCAEFKKANFKQSLLSDLSSDIKLIEGLEETLEALKSSGYSLHVVSGNIVPVIQVVLGENVKYFDSINANNVYFDENGTINYIKGTNYDFEGKAKFINEFKTLTNSDSGDLTFVGNSSNDEWAHQSGCRTICINPDETDSENTTKWHICKENVINLTEILQYFQLNEKNK